jgi:hypothetical protein
MTWRIAVTGGVTGTIMAITAAADAAGGSLTMGSYGLSLSR